MKRKSKIVMATTITILSLTIIGTIPRYDLSAETTDVQRDITTQVSQRVVTPPPPIETQIQQSLPKENEQSNTQIEPISEIDTKPPIEEPILTETAPPQPIEKEISDTTPTENTQLSTKPTTPALTEPTAPKNGDVRFIDGKQQGYLIGFGWVDYMGENEGIFVEDMYENGNKVGIMGGTTVGSDGDINKQVGIMD